MKRLPEMEGNFFVDTAYLLSVYNRFELREKLADFLVFGTYPEVVG